MSSIDNTVCKPKRKYTKKCSHVAEAVIDGIVVAGVPVDNVVISVPNAVDKPVIILEKVTSLVMPAIGARGPKGEDGGNFSLVNTPLTLIDTNEILLPSIPVGEIVFRMMRVIDDVGDWWDYDGVTIREDVSGAYYATLNEPDAIIGRGTVCYMVHV